MRDIFHSNEWPFELKEILIVLAIKTGNIAADRSIENVTFQPHLLTRISWFGKILL